MEKLQIACHGCKTHLAEILDYKVIKLPGGHLVSGIKPEVTAKCPNCGLHRKIEPMQYEYQGS